jgi:DNA-directed RNA polymerase subunit RPC12/RpoP
MSELDVSKFIVNCAECGKEFVKIQPMQKFCCDQCRGKNYWKNKKAKKAAEAPKKRDLFAA